MDLMNTNIDSFPAGWEGYPDKLKDICISCFCADGRKTPQDGIAFLINVQDTTLKSYVGKSVMAYACWVNRFFGDCMFPLELHEDDWINNISRIKTILKCARKSLQDIAVKEGINSYYHKDEEGYLNPDKDIVAISQNLDMFLYISYLFSHEQKKMITCLDRIVDGTCQNIRFLLNHKEIDRLLKMVTISEDSFYIHGMEYWYEPASWLFHESISDQLCGEVTFLFLELIKKLEKLEVPESRIMYKDKIICLMKQRYNELYEIATEYR